MKSTIPPACQGLSQGHVFYITGVSTVASHTLGFAAVQQAVAANLSFRLIGQDQAFCHEPGDQQGRRLR